MKVLERIVDSLIRQLVSTDYSQFSFIPGRQQTWPCRKKVKPQYTTIFLATLVDLPFPMICAKIQPQGILYSGEEDIKRFLPYMGMAAIFVNGQQPF